MVPTPHWNCNFCCSGPASSGLSKPPDNVCYVCIGNPGRNWWAGWSLSVYHCILHGRSDTPLALPPDIFCVGVGLCVGVEVKFFVQALKVQESNNTFYTVNGRSDCEDDASVDDASEERKWAAWSVVLLECV